MEKIFSNQLSDRDLYIEDIKSSYNNNKVTNNAMKTMGK